MRCKGMTLFEVMVALVVFSLAGIALLQSTITQTNAVAAMEDKIFAGWVAQNQMVDVMLSTNWPELTEHSGQETMGSKTYYWVWKGVETHDSQFRAIDVIVKDDEKASDPRITLRSYMAHQ